MPRTQSALLEAMAERQVTVDGVTRTLPAPFLVIATENPIEQEGTFPLPEAQLDRFALRSALGYPSQDEEVDIVVAQRHGHPLGTLEPRVDAGDVETLQAAVEDVYVDDLVLAWIVDLVRATRQVEGVSTGASVRGSLTLERTARSWALLQGRATTSCPPTSSGCSCPSSATGCCSPRRSSRRRAHSGAPARCRRSWSAASSSRRRRRPTGKPRPGDGCRLAA